MAQNGETEVQQSVRRLIGLFGQVLVELGALMGANAQAAPPVGAAAQPGEGPVPGNQEGPPAGRAPSPSGAMPAAESREIAPAPEPEPVRPEPAPDRPEPVPARPVPVRAEAGLLPGPPAPVEGLRERIERAVDSGLAALLAEEREAGNGGDRREAPPAAPAEPVAPAPAAPKPAWLRAAAPPFTEEELAARAWSPAPSAAQAEGDRPQPPEAFAHSDLFLVCEAQQGRNLAIPWNWVIDTRLSSRGTPEAFTLSNGAAERQVQVSAVIGIWSKAELARWEQEVRWLSSLDALAHSQPAEPGAPRGVPAGDPGDPGVLVVSSFPAAGAAAPHPGPALDRSDRPRPVWVVSPSALARRFLMRHLETAGLAIHESRDLDDPLLPADLRSVGALFLDESLLEQWRERSPGPAAGLPVVLLTVDGVLQVPPAGQRPPQGAVLPRPFERSEVEAVIAWLRSLWRDGDPAGDEDHGDEEDDTWLFADPFGSPEP